MKKKATTIRSIIAICIIFLSYLAMHYLGGQHTYCIYKNTLGLPCPGCGMTRSFVSLLNGNISNALYFHPLIFSLPVVLILNTYKIWSDKKHKGNGQRNTIKRFIRYVNLFVLSLFIGLYIYRMFLMFPHTQPMDFNPDAILPRTIRLIKDVGGF